MFLFYLLISYFIVISYGNSTWISLSEESKLRFFLLDDYWNDIRPVKVASDITYVNISLIVNQIMNLDEKNQVMITNVQLTYVRILL